MTLHLFTHNKTRQIIIITKTLTSQKNKDEIEIKKKSNLFSRRSFKVEEDEDRLRI